MQELFEKLERDSGSHKGQNGKVLVIAGSSKYTGAPALVAEAALRSGADLVKILTVEEAKPIVQSFSENMIVESFGEMFNRDSLEKAREMERWADVTVIGPGLSDASEDAVELFGEQAGKLVVDAEAIESLQETSHNIFTPHSGEAKVLEEKYDSLKSFAYENDNTVLRKGETDRIYSTEEVFENETGCAGMTVGGTGDVLAGIVASFKSQGLSNVEAARLAAYVNGKAGEKSFEKQGNGLVATDIIDRIPEVIKD